MGCGRNYNNIDKEICKMKLIVPTFVILPRKTKEDKKYQLNYNALRNINRFTLGALKNQFYDDFKPSIDKFPCSLLGSQVRLIYTITAANKRKFDIANILSVVDKFVCDCLVKDDIITEDNWQYLTSVVYQFGGVTGERTCTLEIIEL